MLRFHINAAEELVEEDAVDQEAQKPRKKGRGVASEANPFAKKKDRSGRIPEMVDSFSSSNIDALAYDPEKKQLWVRFKGQDVYTYYDVPLKIYRGFWSAPSKGHYFWEKIRKNKHIQYQKLTTSLRWVKMEDILNLNSATRRANAASVAKSVLNWMKKNHPEYQPNPVLRDVFNGKQIVCPEFIVDLVGYGNKIRCNIEDRYSGKVQFASSEEQDIMKLVEWVKKLVEKAYSRIGGKHLAMHGSRTLYHTVRTQEAYDQIMKEGLKTGEDGLLYLSEKPFKPDAAYATLRVTVDDQDDLHDWKEFWLDEDGNEIDFDHEYDPDNPYYVLTHGVPVSKIRKVQQLQAATTANTTVNSAYDACLQLLPYLQDAIPEEHWQDQITDLSDDTSRIVADNYTVDITYPEDAKRVKVRVYDYWTQSEHIFDVSLKDTIMTILTGVMIIALQGTDPFPDNFE